MARVKVEIDESLVENARRLVGATTKWEVVEFALRRLVGTGKRYETPPTLLDVVRPGSADTREEA